MRHTIAMFTIPIVLYYLFSRLIFGSFAQHTRQTMGVIGAVIGVLGVKIHYLYRVFTDPKSFDKDDNPDAEDDKSKKEK